MAVSERWSWTKALWLLPLIGAVAWSSWCGYEGLNGQDAHDYLRVSKAWSAWLDGGARPEAAEHPPGFPLAGALIALVSGNEHIALRCLPLIAFLVIGVILGRIMGRSSTPSSVIDAHLLLCIGASPFLLRYSLAIMSDMPAAALMLGSFASILRWRQGGGWSWIFLSVLLSALALTFRLAVAPMLAGGLLFLGLNAIPKKVGAAIVGVVVSGLIIAATLIPVPEWHAVFNGSPLEHWSPWNLFRSEHHSDDGVLRFTVPNLVYVLSVFVHPGFLPIGILLLPFFRWGDLRAPHAGLAAAMLAAYLLFIAGMPFQNDRVLLLAQPFAALLLFPAFVRAWEWCSVRSLRPRMVTMVLLAVQLALFVRAMWPFIRQARTERELAELVNARDPRRVYTHGMGAAFTTYCPGVEITELWYGEIERFDPGALMVVQPANLEEQWEGLPPAENWHRVNRQGLLRVQETADGWLIAEVR